MSGTIQASVLKDSASATSNLALDSSGNVTVGNNLTVSGTGNQIFNGNIGIGVTPSSWGSGTRSLDIGTCSSFVGNNTNSTFIATNAYYNGSNWVYKTSGGQGAQLYGTNGSGTGGFAWYNGGSGTANATVSFTQAMTLDSSGNLLVGQTGTGIQNVNGWDFNRNGQTYFNHVSGSASGLGYALFSYNATQIGSITQSGTTAVLFNTTSDYRLKENVAPITTGLATIGALKPVSYDWVSDKSKGEGFIAHELQAVVPLAVTGEKDAVNEDGSIKPQGVDYSKIVVHLVAALQEAVAKIDALETRIAKLESK